MARVTREAAMRLGDAQGGQPEDHLRELLSILAAGENPDGTEFTLPTAESLVTAWVESATATGAAATATRAAPAAGTALHIVGVAASYSAAQVGVLTLTLAGVAHTFHVHDQRDLQFSKPLRVADASSASASLAAGGVNVGAVALIGFTR